MSDEQVTEQPEEPRVSDSAFNPRNDEAPDPTFNDDEEDDTEAEAGEGIEPEDDEEP